MSDSIAHTKTCQRCKEEFVPEKVNSSRQLCCSKKCYFSFRYYRNKERHRLDYKRRCSVLAASAKDRAKNKGREFTISADFVVYLWDSQEGRCPISGDKFELDAIAGLPHPQGPSLDRIDASGGYTPDNVRLVTCHVNTALLNFGEDELVRLAYKIVKRSTINVG